MTTPQLLQSTCMPLSFIEFHLPRSPNQNHPFLFFGVILTSSDTPLRGHFRVWSHWPLLWNIPGLRHFHIPSGRNWGCSLWS